MFINKPMLDMLSGDRDMMAALLGHEMAHIYLRHSESSANNQVIGDVISLIAGIALEILAERKLGVTNLGLNVGSAMGTVYVATFTREQERDADAKGIEWAIKSGYDPNGAIKLFSQFENRFGNSLFTFTKTHPNPGERIENARQTIASYSSQAADVRIASNNQSQQANRQLPLNAGAQNYKGLATLPPELITLNQKIDEQRLNEAPKSEEAKKGVLAFASKDYSGARISFEKCAAQNEAICQNNLGVLYQNGLGVEVDRKKGLSYYRLASDQKLPIAMANYAGGIARGEEGMVDEAKILGLILESAKLGSPTAMGSLAYVGQMKLSKAFQDDIPDSETLINYAKASAMRGVKDGDLALGSMYRNGYGGLEKNYSLAEKYLSDASRKGDARASASLYLLYKRDMDDDAKAEAIKSRLISLKQSSAMGLIANEYCSENFITRNRKECVFWAKTAAYAGNIGSARLYGSLLYQGMGVDENKAEGAAWVVYSMNKGNQSAIQAVNANISKYSPDEIAEINKRAAEIDAQITASK
jgi:TPR repeat protein